MAALTIQQAFELALHHHQAGRLTEAEALYRQILMVQPNHAGAVHYLGVVAHQMGRHDLAVKLISQATTLEPHNATMYCNLGEAFRAQSRLDEAITAYRRALDLESDFPEAANNLGAALAEQGDFEKAAAAFRRACELRPQYAEAFKNLGNALQNLGQADDAIMAYRRAIESDPRYVAAHYHLGNALKDQGRLIDAIAAYHHVIELKPDYAQAFNDLGVALTEVGRIGDAVVEYRRAIKLKSDYSAAYNNLGAALRDQGDLNGAIATYHRALELEPELVEAHNNLGIALAANGQLDEAIEACRQALKLKPELIEAHNNLGNYLKDQGDLDGALSAYRQALHFQPGDAKLRSNIIFTLHLCPGDTTSLIADEKRRWNQRFGDLLKRFSRSRSNDTSTERRLRIGYVSPDLCDHSVGRNLVPLFRNHDHEHFEILCYAGVASADNFTNEFRQRSSLWRSTVGVTDQEFAEMIRQDGVDILVDLSQHTAGNRLPVFAYQSAPIQVSFAGYPESTGIEAISHRISDRWLEKGGGVNGEGLTTKSTESERVFLLQSFWCYDPRETEVTINELPAERSGWVTFGSLNSFCKINDLVLQLWAQLLRRVKNSRLVLLSRFGSHRKRTVDFLGQYGVEPDRVEFVAPCPRREYLEMYQRLDIALDPFPYGGHTTSLDALWMGVPVTSLAGDRPVSRAGLSILNNLGLPELVTFSQNEYVEIAVNLASDLSRLAELRRTLRSRMENSVLMDGPHFARQIEAAYRAMWRKWCAKQNSSAESSVP